jgi:uncharacterized YigZ family protein
MNAIIPLKIYKEVLIVNKSKFIAVLLPLKNKEEYTNIIDNLKKDYPDATHYCYALRYKGYAKYSDDKEPKGTAGKPILTCLERKNVDESILVVIRYYGGTKLGAGYLLRTYVKSATSVINKLLDEEV